MRVVAWSPEPDARGGRPAGRGLRADAARGGAALGRGHHQRRRQRGDQAAGQRGVPGRHAAGRVPHQHLARHRWWTRRRSSGRCARRASGRGSTSSRTSRRATPARSPTPIVQAPGVYGTHHVGASTDQAQVAIAHEVIRIVQTFQATGEVPNVVNRLARSSATHVLSIRHRNRPGVLAHVFGVLAGGGDQRRRGREHHLPRRPGHAGADPPRRRARRGRAGADPERQSGHHQRRAERDRREAEISGATRTRDDPRPLRPTAHHEERTDDRPHLQFQRRPRRAARARPPEGAGGHLERGRQRHRHHGAQPPRQGVRARSSTRRRRTAARWRGSRTTTRCCSSRAARRSSSRWCR